MLRSIKTDDLNSPNLSYCRQRPLSRAVSIILQHIGRTARQVFHIRGSLWDRLKPQPHNGHPLKSGLPPEQK